MKYRIRFGRWFCIFVALGACQSFADDYRVEVLNEGPPADSLSGDVAKQIADTGLVVTKDESRTVCQLWFCKQWPVADTTKSAADVNYPFAQGQLVGVLALKRKSGDFRDRDLSRGVYTLRYALQPVDGNHVGTFPTRDFLLMVNAENDTSAEPMGVEKLVKLSAKALEASHPALMCLLKPSGDPKTLPAMRHDEDGDWWTVQFKGTTAAGDKSQDLRVDLIVSGHASE
jgi:hypothetical protein